MKLIVVIFCLYTSCATSQNRISINIPSAQQETDYIWRTIIDTKFFEEHNYQVSLPNGPLIEELKTKSKTNSLSDNDYERLKKFVSDHVYDLEDYQKGYEKIKHQQDLINKMINELQVDDYSWTFKEYENYDVNLTLYGPGGSYNPDEGSLLMYTSAEGQFKNYDNPANTIIHEIIHIGIEESIIAKYNVSHPLKERIVDTIVSLHFKKYLPDYRIQDMGEYSIDPHLKNKEDMINLERTVGDIVKE